MSAGLIVAGGTGAAVIAAGAPLPNRQRLGSRAARLGAVARHAQRPCCAASNRQQCRPDLFPARPAIVAASRSRVWKPSEKCQIKAESKARYLGCRDRVPLRRRRGTESPGLASQATPGRSSCSFPQTARSASSSTRMIRTPSTPDSARAACAEPWMAGEAGSTVRCQNRGCFRSRSAPPTGLCTRAPNRATAVRSLPQERPATQKIAADRRILGT